MQNLSAAINSQADFLVHELLQLWGMCFRHFNVLGEI
jgi:hypothetical protein